MRLPLSSSAALTAALALVGCGEAPGIEIRRPAPFVQALRPDHPSYADSYRFDSADTVYVYDSPGGGFRVHYATVGRNAVPVDELTGDPSVPDFVEDVGAVYDAVLAFYRDTLGYLAPLADSGVSAADNDARFDVYLVDFGSGADGAFRIDDCLLANPDQCIGYMVQENDFAGFAYASTHQANLVLASHEFFHAIQAAYDTNQGPILGEGTATWASEQFDPTLGDFEGAIGGYLRTPDHALDVPPPGPVSAFSYGAGLFFQFLGERFGVATVRTLLERTANGALGVDDPDWYTALPQLLLDTDGTSFGDAWLEFATWNLYTGSLADPAVSYANGGAYPLVASVTVTAPYSNAALRVAHSAAEYYKLRPSGRTEMTAALVGPPEELADLHLVLAVNVSDRWRDVRALTNLEAGTETVVTDGAKNLIVVVVNSGTDTASRHPGLCVGTLDEVAACKAALTTPVTPPSETPPADDEGCDCASASAMPGFGIAMIALLGCARRRRQS